MRRPTILALAVLPLLLAADGRKRTVDGRSFPDAGPRVLDLRLPVCGNALGGLPEGVPGSASVYPIDAAAGPVPGWRKQLAEHHVDTAGYDYVANGADGARCVLIGLTDGRVSRLGYFFPGLTPGRVAAIMKSCAAAGADAWLREGECRVVVGGVRVLAGLAGEHRVTVVDQHYTTIQDYNAGDTGTTTHTEGYPSCVEFRVDPADWYLATHALPTDVAAGIRDGQLAVGMTLLEARLAMGAEGTAVGADGGGAAYQWTPSKDVTYVAAFESGRLVRFRRVP